MKPNKPNEKPTKHPLAPEQLEPPARLERLQSIGLPVALGISIAIALLLTSISMGLYFSSNLSRIDLSKPKYADVRQDVRTADQEEFDNEGPITQEVIQDAIKKLEQDRKDLRALGDFTSPALNNKQLGIGD